VVRAPLEDSDIEVYGLAGPALHRAEHRAFIDPVDLIGLYILISKSRSLHSNLSGTVSGIFTPVTLQPYRDDSHPALQCPISTRTVPSMLMNQVSPFEATVSVKYLL
jgi:hypothetical protein